MRGAKVSVRKKKSHEMRLRGPGNRATQSYLIRHVTSPRFTTQAISTITS